MNRRPAGMYPSTEPTHFINKSGGKPHEKSGNKTTLKSGVDGAGSGSLVPP